MNNVEAINFIGLCYENGDGVRLNQEQAFIYYLKAAQINFPTAMYNVGRCYEYGIYVNIQKNEANKWYRKAASLGHHGALEKIK